MMKTEIYDFETIHRLKKTIEQMDLDGPPTIHLLLKAKDGIHKNSGRLGVFPSSFNPLTVSHAELIDRAIADFGMDEVLLVLDKQTLDKDRVGASLEDRLLMLLIYCENRPKLSVGLSSHGLFVEKISALRAVYPSETAIHFIVGFDTIIRVMDKKYYTDRERSLQELFSRCSFLAANRSGGSIEDIQALFKKSEHRWYAERVKTFIISEILASVSSTQVREHLQQRQTVAELIPPDIEAFIRETEAYGPGRTQEEQSAYELRSGLIDHLYHLSPEAPAAVDLKKTFHHLLSETSLGKEMRRVISIPGIDIPRRPRWHLPETVEGNFDLTPPTFRLEGARVEASRCLQCEHPPCERHCLPGLPIRELLRLVSRGDLEKAYLRMRETQQLCGMTEYLCQTKEHYCEYHCLSASLFGRGNEIAVQTVLRTVWEQGRTKYEGQFEISKTFRAALGSSRQKIAVVGSGPAGLQAAMDLAKRGYEIWIFEKQESIGGVPRSETPVFRFPADTVFEQVEKDLRHLSVHLQTGVCIGRDLSIDDLRAQGYAAIFVATGLTVAKTLGIPGEALKGVTSSIDLFQRFARDGAEALDQELSGRRGYVIDSGNTAMDTSRLLRRLGAEVTCIYWKDSPRALLKEIEAAKAEGVSFMLSAMPVALISDGGGVVSCLRICQTSYSDSTKQWETIPGTEQEYPADFCVYAIGARPGLLQEGLDINSGGHVLVDHRTMQTSIPEVFAGGDVVERGNISRAIRDGRKAAVNIQEMLQQQGSDS